MKYVCPPLPHRRTSKNSLASLTKIYNLKTVTRKCTMCIMCINHIHFIMIERLKNWQGCPVGGPRTCSKDVLGPHWPNGGPSENKQMCHGKSRHPLYFIISRTCFGCLDHTLFTMTMTSLKNSAGRLVGMSPGM